MKDTNIENELMVLDAIKRANTFDYEYNIENDNFTIFLLENDENPVFLFRGHGRDTFNKVKEVLL